MAATRYRMTFASLHKSVSSLTRKSRNCAAETTKFAVGQPHSNSRIQTICGSALSQNSKTSLVQTISKNYAAQLSRSFHQKFPPVIASNPLSLVVAENLINTSELEESSEGEDEATSGRKRIRSRNLSMDDP